MDEKKRNVILTHKKMLLNTKLPILTKFDQLEKGMEVEGFIAKISDKGVLVAFYDEMKVKWQREYSGLFQKKIICGCVLHLFL